MSLGAIAFLSGILILHALAELPNPGWSLGLPVVVAIIVYLPRLRLPAGCAAGFLWALLWVHFPMQTPFSSELESVDLRVEGWIAAIPEAFFRSTRFLFQIESIQSGDLNRPTAGRLRLFWYNTPPPLRVGDKWSLTVRVKRARGLANPGNFDYQRWLWANGIAAQGYVRDSPEPQLLNSADRYPVDRFRQSLAERFSGLLPGNAYAGILIALAVGESRLIPQWQWEVFNRTGTGHLLSISGLHVGLIAGLLFVLVGKGWGWIPCLIRRWPASKAAALAAMAGAGGYALLAGLSLPTQRALIMIWVAMSALLWQRPVVPSRILALALLAVLIIDPLAPLSAGFWLSFGAVAAIFYTLAGRGGRVWRDWLGLQLAITLALLPATLVFFQQIPILSPLANLIAIPWSNVTVVPLALLAVLAGFVSETVQLGLLNLAVVATDWLWRFLGWLARSPWALVYYPAPPAWTLAFTLPGLLLLLAPGGIPRRWLGGLLCLPLVFFPRFAPAPGAVWLSVLEVGQGLSAVIRTADHVLVYDTGPRRGGNFDAGRTVLVPFLRQQGIGQLDTLIISHADNEHLGGTRSLLESFKAVTILTSSPEEVPIEGAQACRAGMEWNWDGVRFRILHPLEPGAFSANNTSCVLLVESPHGQVLLPGDIESSAQAALLNTYGPALAAEVLVAPGHGAGDAPLKAFIAAVRPRYVLFSTGYKNRFGFPKPAVVESFQEAGAVLMDTAQEGAMTFKLEGVPEQPVIERYRRQNRRYWQTDAEE